MVPQYMADEEMNKERYHEMLRSDIRHYLSRSSCRILEDMLVRATEIDLEMERKRKTNQVQGSRSSGNRANIFDSRLRGQQGRGVVARLTMGHARWVVLVASSVARQVTSAGIALLLPPALIYMI